MCVEMRGVNLSLDQENGVITEHLDDLVLQRKRVEGLLSRDSATDTSPQNHPQAI